MPFLFKKHIRFPESLRLISELFTVVLLLICPEHMAILLVLSKLILTIRVKVDVLASDVLDLLRCEEQTVVSLATNIHSVNMSRLLALKVHDILMMEVLDCT